MPGSSEDDEVYYVEWCYIEFSWEYDEEMEMVLKDNYPFRSVKEHYVPTYVFDKTVDSL